MSAPRVYAFGPYRLDVKERQLRREGQPVPLPPKLFDLLTTLVQQSGHLLRKEDLLDAVWADVAVEEGSLTRAISSLRQLLGPSPDGTDYVQTVAKRGYRFAAPVQESVEERQTARDSSRIPLPPQLTTPPAVAFVGRERELSELDAMWQRAKNGRPQLLFVAGEPGIGKTRLSLEFARARSAEGAAILMGCSDEEALVPYQPFVESLGWYVRGCDESELRAQVSAAGGGAELGALVPELRRRIPDLDSSPAMSPEAQRYRLFEAVTAMLSTASRREPILLVFDDLHWADKTTLLLVRHVMRSAGASRFAIITTYRESELDRSHPLADMLTTMRREHNVTRLSLRGLDAATIGGLVAGMVGRDAPPQLARFVAESTEGNPFFATEMLRHLKESGAIGQLAPEGRGMEISRLGLPEGVKEVVGRRLSRLSEVCNRVLSVAAAMGREFDVAVLQQVAGVSEDEVIEALEQASRAQLVGESREAHGRFTFTHALIRETLHGELSSPRRVRLHSRLAETIERLTQERALPPRLAELAYHFTQSASAGSIDKAVEYATRAGEQAADALAHEEAIRLFGMALQSLDFKTTDAEVERLRVELHARRARAFDALGEWTMETRELDTALRHLDPEQAVRRCELMLALARALFLLFDIRPVERWATEAMVLAERLHRPDLQAHALAWLARTAQARGNLDDAISMDRQTLVLAPGVPTATHMLGPLTLYLAGRSPEALVLASDGADAARSSRDTTLIMYSLSHLGLNLTGTGRYAEASAIFQEARVFGRKYGAHSMLARVTAMTAGLHFNVFDYEGADGLRAEARELARSAGFAPPLISSNIDALLAHARCHDPGPVEQLLEQTVAGAAATGGWHQWLWQLRLAQARAELALARGAIDDAIALAGEAIDTSHARRRPKYEALGFMTRARSLHARGETRSAIADARRALQIAEAIADPALLLLTLDVLIDLDGSDELAAQAGATIDRIRRFLPDDSMRAVFDASEVVQRVGRPGRV
jgi:DNA-binding winged helix-turn-helix (wHTH) protein/tetratricopeptide (TPR) repeat protein